MCVQVKERSQGCTPEVASLPSWEICIYWLLSFGSHLYSFKELHRFSKEYEEGLMREFEFEKGFLIWGFKKDPTDFEWSFWNERARKSLLWSLLGHVLVSKLAGFFAPKRSWYRTENEYYLLVFSLAISCLRYISFSLDYCWQASEEKSLDSFFWLSAYVFYHPLFSNGPIMNFGEFTRQMQKPHSRVVRLDTWAVLVSLARLVAWWILAEAMVCFMYMHAVQSNETYLKIMPSWALGGLALAQVLFFYVKYLVLFGVPSLVVRLDGIESPKLPRCVSTMYSFTGMWRHFDVGLYRWLVRYIYVPLGGSHHGVVQKTVSTALVFGFVCYWHGGHDYLVIWALLNWMGVITENGVKAFLSLPPVYTFFEQCLSAAMMRRGQAFLSAFCTAMLILSNLVFLGGSHVGKILWLRIFVQGWPNVAVPVLGFLYCFTQIGMEWDKTHQ
ncbi:protein-cysteine N-palmitoyltransferase HHAT isoform X2 [Lepisosteus oculatus]|uniref:protein-cysteine N-palmitoyltransferase HHAT isoform X2 n=1 Tax=Lepisosteus oculatus TaxID=7918 RepID=UPI00073FC596|nr:PREDICTED: protein-cysteine N-palmitoyltransferase HHAT isoform X2 [Lepisosteus oculatus]